MDYFVAFVNGILGFLVVFYHSALFSVIKFLFGVYAAVLFVDIVLLLVQRGLSGDIKDTLIGMNIPPELVKPKKKDALRRRWEKIKGRMESGKESDYKIAIIEGDSLIDDLIKRMGYDGNNLGERLEKVQPGQIENLEDLKNAHLVRNKIIHEEKLEISKEQADEIISAYEEFLRLFEVLD